MTLVKHWLIMSQIDFTFFTGIALRLLDLFFRLRINYYSIIQSNNNELVRRKNKHVGINMSHVIEMSFPQLLQQ